MALGSVTRNQSRLVEISTKETAKRTLEELQLEADEVRCLARGSTNWLRAPKNMFVSLTCFAPQVLMMELIDFAREQGGVSKDIQELIAKALAEAGKQGIQSALPCLIGSAAVDSCGSSSSSKD